MNAVVEFVGREKLLAFWCPGCRELHAVYREESPNPKTGAAWSWNGDSVRPTIRPSILVEGFIEAGRFMKPRCHCDVTEGFVKFRTDCEHELKGRTLRLRENPTLI